MILFIQAQFLLARYQLFRIILTLYPLALYS